MSERQQKDNSGALFKNDKKGNDNAPDYKGPAMVSGQAKEMAAWLKESANGTKYMSVSFSEPFKKQEAKAPARQAIDDDSAIPF